MNRECTKQQLNPKSAEFKRGVFALGLAFVTFASKGKLPPEFAAANCQKRCKLFGVSRLPERCRPTTRLTAVALAAV